MSKTQWIAAYDVVAEDPQTTDAWKAEAKTALRRLCAGFNTYDEAIRHENLVLRPLFNRAR